MTISDLLGRAFFIISYPLYYKAKLEKTNHAKLFGFSLTIPPRVFHPGLFFSTKIFGKYLLSLDVADKKVLEMGTGSGLLSLILAKTGLRSQVLTSIQLQLILQGKTQRRTALKIK